MAIISEENIYVKLTDEERDGVMTPKHIYDAVDIFFKEGVVIIQNAIPTHVLDKVNEQMDRDYEELSKSKGRMHFSGRYESGVPATEGGNLSQSQPFTLEHFFPEIYGNVHAGEVIADILGPRPEVHYMRANSLLPTKEKQLVHVDLRFRFAPHPAVIALNIPLVDAGPGTGSTLLWLGTQNNTTDAFIEFGKQDIHPDRLAERMKVRPPIQPTVPKGSIVIRDLRIWQVIPSSTRDELTSRHCGMPNPTGRVRHMLGLSYYPRWYKNAGVIPMPESLRPRIEECEKRNGTYFSVRYVPDEGYNYLDIPFDNNFSSSLTPEIWAEVQEMAEAVKVVGKK